MFQYMKFTKDYFEGFLWWKKLIAARDRAIIVVDESEFHYTGILTPEEKFLIIPKEYLKNADFA